VIGTVDEVVTGPVLSRLYGAPIEVLTDSRGRRFVVGLEEETSHPHPHSLAPSGASSRP
jgi:zinc/manganese transport system ATP-binding protein